MQTKDITEPEHEGHSAQAALASIRVVPVMTALAPIRVVPVMTPVADAAPTAKATVAVVPVMAPLADGAPASRADLLDTGSQPAIRSRRLTDRPRAVRRLAARSLVAGALLGLLVTALVAHAGLAWSPLAFSLWNGAAVSAPFTATPAPDVPATPAPIPAAQLADSPQGCAPGAPTTATPDFPMLSARGAASVRNEVALTFDDGPSPVYTPRILAALKAAGAHATFFVIGSHVEKHPDQVRAEWLAGDAIGNHTYQHDWVAGMTAAQIRATLMVTTTAIVQATGDPCVWLFRPPYGGPNWNVRVAGEARNEGLTTVTWDLAALDWERPGAGVIAQRIISRLHGGAVILLHDAAPDREIQDRSQTVAALPLILAAIHARGFQAVTLPKLLADAWLARPTPVAHSAHDPRPPRGGPGWPPAPRDAGSAATAVAPPRTWW